MPEPGTDGVDVNAGTEQVRGRCRGCKPLYV
jgi:hypothetical protein